MPSEATVHQYVQEFRERGFHPRPSPTPSVDNEVLTWGQGFPLPLTFQSFYNKTAKKIENLVAKTDEAKEVAAQAVAAAEFRQAEMAAAKQLEDEIEAKRQEDRHNNVSQAVEQLSQIVAQQLDNSEDTEDDEGEDAGTKKSQKSKNSKPKTPNPDSVKKIKGTTAMKEFEAACLADPDNAASKGK
jgi:hypothetical protein